MDAFALIPGLAPLDSAIPIAFGRIDTAAWRDAAVEVSRTGGRLLSLWGQGGGNPRTAAAVHVAYALPGQLVWLELPLAGDAPAYPDLTPLFPAAARLQRACADLHGLHAEGALDRRPWLDHGLWPDGDADTAPADYAFVRVEGDGVHEIAVGPVHAGIIEPGHFRFSVVGEKVLRLEQRLGYTHKGIGRRFTEIDPLQAHRLAGRLSGDSTVAHAWAFCMALESACGTHVPERGLALRALLLERERVANHLGDLGALGNDAALGFALAQFSRLREDWQRLSGAVFGHRLMMDCVCPGGVAADIDAAAAARLREQCATIEESLRALRAIYDEHAGLQDRFVGTGRIDAGLAARLGATGLAARASALAIDLRSSPGWPPYDRLGVRRAGADSGDVAARVSVRFDEALESLRLIGVLIDTLPRGPVRAPARLPTAAVRGAGAVEGWRGEVFCALQLDDSGRIASCQTHDPSWQNWPLLEHAVIGNIVPDFPLINKSFNLSYSGHDL